MIDLVQSKQLKKSSKKLKSIENKLNDSVPLEKPAKRRRKSSIYSETESTITEVVAKVITPPSSPISVEFIQSRKQLSPFDDIDSTAPLADIIGRHSAQHPQSSLKCVWTAKEKILKKNNATCVCFTNLEKSTLKSLSKAVKSKRRFIQLFKDFETTSLEIQCDYPHCKSPPTSSTSTQCSTSRKLVKKSIKSCSKSKKGGELLKLGSKHPRSELVAKKAKYSTHFINKVCCIMLEHPRVWDEAIMVKLLQTKQLRTRYVPELAKHLLKQRNLALFKMCVKWLKPWHEKLIVEVLHYILKEDKYMSGTDSSVDGKERQELEEYLLLALDMRFDHRAMFGVIREINSDQARVLLKFISDKLNSSCVKKCKGDTLQLLLSQVVAWIEVLVEAFFGALSEETDLIKRIYNNVTNLINSCRSTTSLSEHMFRIRHPKKFRPKDKIVKKKKKKDEEEED